MAKSEKRNQELNKRHPVKHDSPAEVEFTCLSQKHAQPVTYTVKKGQSTACPSCGR